MVGAAVGAESDVGAAVGAESGVGASVSVESESSSFPECVWVLGANVKSVGSVVPLHRQSPRLSSLGNS